MFLHTERTRTHPSNRYRLHTLPWHGQSGKRLREMGCAAGKQQVREIRVPCAFQETGDSIKPIRPSPGRMLHTAIASVYFHALQSMACCVAEDGARTGEMNSSKLHSPSSASASSTHPQAEVRGLEPWRAASDVQVGTIETGDPSGRWRRVRVARRLSLTAPIGNDRDVAGVRVLQEPDGLQPMSLAATIRPRSPAGGAPAAPFVPQGDDFLRLASSASSAGSWSMVSSDTVS